MIYFYTSETINSGDDLVYVQMHFMFSVVFVSMHDLRVCVFCRTTFIVIFYVLFFVPWLSVGIECICLCYSLHIVGIFAHVFIVECLLLKQRTKSHPSKSYRGCIHTKLTSVNWKRENKWFLMELYILCLAHSVRTLKSALHWLTFNQDKSNLSRGFKK